MIKQQLSQSLQQKLSPLQIQQIKMLELSSLEIEERIRRELEENPALEQAEEWDAAADNAADADTDEYEQESRENSESREDLSLGDYFSEDDIPDYKLNDHNYSRERSYEQIPYSEPESFHASVLEQLRLRDLSEEEMKIGEYIIGNIDDDGYLRREFSAIADDLLFQYGMDASEDEMETVLDIIHDLDPPGIGARNLQECLLLQLKKHSDSDANRCARNILHDHFDDFTKKHYDKIQKSLNISEDRLKEAIKEIIQLNPKPGNAFESDLTSKLSQVTPDFIVENVSGELVLQMNSQNVPVLKVSREYSNMLTEYVSNRKNQSADARDAVQFVKQKLDAAKWFIDAVKQRQGTLKSVMAAIMVHQQDFFLSGDETDIKPMILKDVSERCGYDISTISRVSNSKYVQTDSGIYSLKFFFSEGMQNEKGEEISTREIKTILKECVDEENKKSPLTDEKLTELLKEKGYDLARRTVAKYREQLDIPVARLRKEL
jgi:RNA polymerase sigma-54 factor